VSPSAEDAGAVRHVAAAAETIGGGDEVILAIKPSGWFVLLASWPVIAVAVAIAAGTRVFGIAGPHQAVPLACVAMGCIRVMAACAQWMGILYVLTNRRVIRVHGAARPDVRSYPLTEIADVQLAAGALEGFLGVGTLLFTLSDGTHADLCWVHVSSPKEVQAKIVEAIRRAS
jgi:hypothetical protein